MIIYSKVKNIFTLKKTRATVWKVILSIWYTYICTPLCKKVYVIRKRTKSHVTIFSEFSTMEKLLNPINSEAVKSRFYFNPLRVDTLFYIENDFLWTFEEIWSEFRFFIIFHRLTILWLNSTRSIEQDHHYLSIEHDPVWTFTQSNSCRIQIRSISIRTQRIFITL